jgi:hypothetical protein
MHKQTPQNLFIFNVYQPWPDITQEKHTFQRELSFQEIYTS